MGHLRLAIVTPRFWPLVGDGPTHLLRLAESLIAAGHQAKVVTPQWKRSWPAEMAIGPVPIVRLTGSARGGWSSLRWMYALSRWLGGPAGTELDAAIVAGLKHEAYVALGAAPRTHMPCVLIAEQDDVEWQKSATLGGRIADRCLGAPAIVAPGEELADALRRAGFSADRVTVIPRRVDIPPARSPKAREDARAALAAVNYDLVTTAN